MTHPDNPDNPGNPDNPVTTDVTVTGMTCGHCVASISEELGAIEGVARVAVALDTGVVTISSAAPIDPADIAAAVAEAGYALV
jgi:copper chaperone